MLKPSRTEKARHDAAVAPVCLNTPSAITLLRSLETGGARSEQAVPELAGASARPSAARGLDQLALGESGLAAHRLRRVPCGDTMNVMGP